MRLIQSDRLRLDGQCGDLEPFLADVLRSKLDWFHEMEYIRICCHSTSICPLWLAH